MIFHENIIVGQGIGGSCLALQMFENEKDFLVIDSDFKDSSTYISAGLFNPVVFKRLTHSWNAKGFIPYSKGFYRHWEEILDSQFYNPLPYLKIISSWGEKVMWEQSIQENANHYVDYNKTSQEPGIFKSDFGYGLVNESGYVDTATFLTTCRKKLEEENRIINASFDTNKAVYNEGVWEIKVDNWLIKCKNIIFCEGHKISDNPYFSYLPFKSTKGEIGIISCPGLTRNFVIHHSCFVMPYKDETFIVGSTYDWDQVNTIPTQEAKDSLGEKFKKISPLPFKWVEQKVGIRPTLKDRRPILGKHPNKEGLFVLNGFGSKGIMQAPLLSKMLLDYIYQKEEIPEEVNVARFSK